MTDKKKKEEFTDYIQNISASLKPINRLKNV